MIVAQCVRLSPFVIWWQIVLFPFVISCYHLIPGSRSIIWHCFDWSTMCKVAPFLIWHFFDWSAMSKVVPIGYSATHCVINFVISLILGPGSRLIIWHCFERLSHFVIQRHIVLSADALLSVATLCYQIISSIGLLSDTVYYQKITIVYQVISFFVFYLIPCYHVICDCNKSWSNEHRLKDLNSSDNMNIWWCCYWIIIVQLSHNDINW